VSTRSPQPTCGLARAATNFRIIRDWLALPDLLARTRWLIRVSQGSTLVKARLAAVDRHADWQLLQFPQPPFTQPLRFRNTIHGCGTSHASLASGMEMVHPETMPVYQKLEFIAMENRPLLHGLMEWALRVLDFVFGCHHSNLSRVFTIEGRTYRLCCTCGARFNYSLETMAMDRRAYWPAPVATSMRLTPSGGRFTENDFRSTKPDLQQIPRRSEADEVSVSRKSGQPVLATPAHSTWVSLQTAALWVTVVVIFLFPGTASAANLKPETRKAWEEYVVAANAQMQERLSPSHPFLLSDEDPGRAARLRSGEILVSPAGPHIPKRVPSGLIHDWNGEAFIPNTTLQDVLRVLRDYDCYKEFYHPTVVDSRALVSGESEDQFSMLLVNESLVSKTALDSDFRSSYFRVNDQHWYSVSQSMRIQEVAGYGTAGQHMLPEDEGTGLIWRAFGITRFEERDGGVYVELETIILSRDIPLWLRWMADPIVRRVSRESLLTSFRQTQDAVRSRAKLGERYAASGRCSNETGHVAARTGSSVVGSLR
jgi:hypothetical protein